MVLEYYMTFLSDKYGSEHRPQNNLFDHNYRVLLKYFIFTFILKDMDMKII